jgi:endoglucanase
MFGKQFKPLCLMLAFVFSANAHAASATCKEAANLSPWYLWQGYQKRFVQHDGRVLDQTGERDFTTSESEAYTLFFALVNNDRQRFEVVLNWIEANLSKGDFAHNLPAWHWGRQTNGKWEILDPNSASDADTWLAYTLLQAGSLWSEARYTRLGMTLLEQIKAKEVVPLPDGGTMLLPAPQGFAEINGKWRFNPSYLPIQLLRAFAQADPTGPWSAMTTTTLQMIRSTASRGFAPDWVSYQHRQGWAALPENEPVGSYDAIRTYLWVGMLDDDDTIKPQLIRSLSGMRRYLLKNNGSLMETVNTLTGATKGIAPLGFSAALLPYLYSLNERKLLDQQARHLTEKMNGGLIGDSPIYYDQILSMFGQGWLEQRFKFGNKGQLIPAWSRQCHF